MRKFLIPFHRHFPKAPGEAPAGRRRLLLQAGAGLLLGAGLGARGAAHPGHGEGSLLVEVGAVRRREGRLDVRLRLDAQGVPGRMVVDAFALGAILDRRALPLPVPATGGAVLDLSLRYAGPVPARQEIRLLVMPEGVLQAVDVLTGG
ncbi:hypothetical protein PSA7680_00367 [Pseudoruegeria aquimaris]|uniref:Uncharacterized protein n=1 Tax=Pseudoruegeria aquimaris TaxID=393663 RepID=A0A1Y5RF95_9RHOB|nr:hypothetical protein [Pseudoruegeria aquimaris]SLN14846.1 hypothetical protein PSA7680_00367 [Pseudoruegeria aquimaris]